MPIPIRDFVRGIIATCILVAVFAVVDAISFPGSDGPVIILRIGILSTLIYGLIEVLVEECVFFLITPRLRFLGWPGNLFFIWLAALLSVFLAGHMANLIFPVIYMDSAAFYPVVTIMMTLIFVLIKEGLFNRITNHS